MQTSTAQTTTPKKDDVPPKVRQLEMRLDEEADETLGPYLVGLYECFDTAWKWWQDLGERAPQQFAAVGSRSRANLVYDFVCVQVKERYGDDTANIRLSDKRGFLTMLIKDRYLVRFKKLDKNRCASVGKTHQASLFFDQLTLPGIAPDVVPVISGYQIDSAQVDMKDVLLTLQWGKTVMWFKSIRDIALEVRAQQPASTANNPGDRAQKPGRRVQVTPRALPTPHHPNETQKEKPK